MSYSLYRRFTRRAHDNAPEISRHQLLLSMPSASIARTYRCRKDARTCMMICNAAAAEWLQQDIEAASLYLIFWYVISLAMPYAPASFPQHASRYHDDSPPDTFSPASLITFRCIWEAMIAAAYTWGWLWCFRFRQFLKMGWYMLLASGASRACIATPYHTAFLARVGTAAVRCIAILILRFICWIEPRFPHAGMPQRRCFNRSVIIHRRHNCTGENVAAGGLSEEDSLLCPSGQYSAHRFIVVDTSWLPLDITAFISRLMDAFISRRFHLFATISATHYIQMPFRLPLCYYHSTDFSTFLANTRQYFLRHRGEFLDRLLFDSYN